MVDPDDVGGETFEGELQQLRQKVRLLQADRQFMQEEIQRLQGLGSAAGGQSACCFVRTSLCLMLFHADGILPDAANDQREQLSEQLKQQLLATTADLAAARTLNAKLLAKLQLAARALQLQRHALDDVSPELLGTQLALS
jgi:hypothetical protein